MKRGIIPKHVQTRKYLKKKLSEICENLRINPFGGDPFPASRPARPWTRPRPGTVAVLRDFLDADLVSRILDVAKATTLVEASDHNVTRDGEAAKRAAYAERYRTNRTCFLDAHDPQSRRATQKRVLPLSTSNSESKERSTLSERASTLRETLKRDEHPESGSSRPVTLELHR